MLPGVHVISCEKDASKRRWIVSNFPVSCLFTDITDLPSGWVGNGLVALKATLGQTPIKPLNHPLNQSLILHKILCWQLLGVLSEPSGLVRSQPSIAKLWIWTLQIWCLEEASCLLCGQCQGGLECQPQMPRTPGKINHTPPCSNEGLCLFAETNRVQRGNNSVADMVPWFL